MNRSRLIFCALVLVLAGTSLASAQSSDFQVWGDVSLNWLKQGRVSWALDLEPKVLVVAPEGDPKWREFDVTPAVEFAAKNWLDLTGELGTSYTRQTDGLNTLEVTPRVGFRFHFLSRALPTVASLGAMLFERPPKRRAVLRDLVRVEGRNLFYSDDTPTSSTIRFRNRLEFQFPLNRVSVAEDGSLSMLTDWEWYIPLGDPEERFASQQRIRIGLAFRHSFGWRTEVLYVWTRSRNTIDEPYSTSDNALSITLKRFFK